MAEPAEVKKIGDSSTSIEGLEELLEVQEVSHEELQEERESAHEGAHESDAIMESYWTTAEAAEHLDVSMRTVMKKLKDGSLQGVKVEGKYRPEWRIKPIEIDTTDHEESREEDEGDSVVHDRVHEPDHEQPEARLLPAPGKSEFIELMKMLQKKDHELQGAIYRNGYLEAQLEAQGQQTKLLEDKSTKAENLDEQLKEVQEQYSELEEEKIRLQAEIERYKELAERPGWKKFCDWMMGRKPDAAKGNGTT